MSIPFFCLICTFESFLFFVWAVYCVFNCASFLKMLGLTNQPKGREFDSDEDDETASQRYLKQVHLLRSLVINKKTLSRSYFIAICFCDALVICTLSGKNQQIGKFVKTHTDWNLADVAAGQIYTGGKIEVDDRFVSMNTSWRPKLGLASAFVAWIIPS